MLTQKKKKIFLKNEGEKIEKKLWKIMKSSLPKLLGYINIPNQCSQISWLRHFKTRFSLFFYPINDQPHFWIAQLEHDPKHIRHASLSLMAPEFMVVKLHKIPKCGNTVPNT